MHTTSDIDTAKPTQTAGDRCPGLARLVRLASARLTQPGALAGVAAPASMSRTSAVGSEAAGSWSIRTAPGCAAKSAAVHRKRVPVPVV